MPHKHHAIKDLRKSKKHATKNSDVRGAIKLMIKKSRKAVETKDATAEQMVKDAIKKIDKATQKGILKKNTAARKKSRLMKRLNKSKKA
jgi:small subunit ribosomal protein S20